MIEHNLYQIDLSEDYAGIQIQPSEKENLFIPSSLRQFIIQANRAYSKRSLENFAIHEDLILVEHPGYLSHHLPFFHIKLTLENNNMDDFMDIYKKELEEIILIQLGQSKQQFVSGNRCAFLGEFRKEKSNNVVSTNILIGTSVFYNDYRVTINFPGTEEELFKEANNIINTITESYPTLKVNSVLHIL